VGLRDTHPSVAFIACRPDEPSRSFADGEAVQGFLKMELAGLEPATSWVRSRRSPN
jgi:hypothetical protein